MKIRVSRQDRMRKVRELHAKRLRIELYSDRDEVNRVVIVLWSASVLVAAGTGRTIRSTETKRTDKRIGR